MFNIGDLFVYGTKGACRISDIKTEKFSKDEKTYYILVPVFDTKEKIFVPVDNEKLVSKMKRILSPIEMKELIKSIPERKSIWIDNVNLRREEYKKIINSADREHIISLLKTLHERRSELKKAGKNLSVYDERFLRQAQNIIHSEIAIVFQIPLGEVDPYIRNTIYAA